MGTLRSGCSGVRSSREAAGVRAGESRTGGGREMPSVDFLGSVGVGTIEAPKVVVLDAMVPASQETT